MAAPPVLLLLSGLLFWWTPTIGVRGSMPEYHSFLFFVFFWIITMNEKEHAKNLKIGKNN